MGRKSTGCLPEIPAKDAVYLKGRAVNLSAISRATGLDKGYLSRIISRKVECGISTYRKIASALGMGLEDLLDGIDIRKTEMEAALDRIIQQYDTRITREDEEDRTTQRRGRIVRPRLPGMRVPKVAS